MKYTHYILGLILLLPTHAFAIDIDTFRKEVYRPDNLPGGTALKDTTAEDKINFIINYATDIILYTSGSFAVFFLILGGIQYITSLGNQERMDAAKKTLKHSLIGLIVVIFAYAVITNIIDIIFKATV